jgi:hypothetical protein
MFTLRGHRCGRPRARAAEGGQKRHREILEIPERIWNEECSDEFHESEAQFSMQDGPPQPTGSEGALVVVNVVDYRYVSIGARVIFGIMTGNAFINAQVGFRDLKTGETWATKTYDTKSSAWNGVFAAMTTKQVRAICHEILGEVSAH